MIRKMFVGVGECPYKEGTAVGSVGCRGCKYYFGEPAFSTFVYCKCPPELMEAPKPVKTGKRRGRPPKNGQNKPVDGKTNSK